MAKQNSSVLNFLAWFTGIVVSLVVGFAMISGTLALPGWLGGETAVGVGIVWAVGWIVLITTLLGAIMALIKR